MVRVIVPAPDEIDVVQNVQNVQEDRKSSSTFPKSVYENLPELLKEACGKFQSDRERDIFLLGAIAVLSGCFSSVRGRYNQGYLHPHLYALIIAPPGSGKGVLSYAKLLASAIHNKYLNQKMEHALVIADVEIKEAIHQEGQDALIEAPLKERFPLFLPANISSAAFFQHLNESDGSGIMFENEIDTLVNALRQGWGDYSVLLRNAFHHETVSYRRKAENELIEIVAPKLAVVLSGTPAQAISLINSTENGLFSRFCFYNYKVAPIWRDVTPNQGQNLEEYFQGLSDQVLEMYDFTSENPFEFCLEQNQWNRFNEQFEKYLMKVSTLISEDANNIVYRLGNITFRISMVLTSIQRAIDKRQKPQITCDDNVFQAALEISEILLAHSLTVFNLLPNKNSKILTVDQLKFYNELPKGVPFKRVDAVRIGRTYLSLSAIDKFLRKLLGSSLIKQVKHGVYVKQ